MQAAHRLHPQRPGRDPAQAGSLTIEMAVVLPVILTLVFGIIEIANILRIQMTLHSAVTTIAHDASMHETSQGSAEQFMNANGLLPKVKQSASAPDPVLTLSPPVTSTCKALPCTPFEVTLSYNYQAMIEPMKPFFDNIQLSASARKLSEPW
ncbi:TadE/TadG family type IV pilus assembly protein [Solidesulfovibrio sp.]